MRTFAMLGWLMIPVVVGAYHFGPGQSKMQLEEVDSFLQAAERDVAGENWPEAVSAFEQALALLPANRARESRQVRIERAKAQMFAKQLPEASAGLKELVDELQADEKRDSKQMTDALASLANAQYYMTWLMRLEGLGRDEWEPEIESSRQTYRILAEQTIEQGDHDGAKHYQEDLESAIRLARMEPGELQGLAIPKQCQGCKSGQCKKPGRRPSRNAQKAKDARGASSGPPPDNSGS